VVVNNDDNNNTNFLLNIFNYVIFGPKHQLKERMDLLSEESGGLVQFNSIGEKFNRDQIAWRWNQNFVRMRLTTKDMLSKVKLGLHRAAQNGYIPVSPLEDKTVTTKYIEKEMVPMNPVDRLKEIVKQYGEPDLYYSEPGGKAIWTRRTLEKRENTRHVHEIVVEDIFAVHIFPMPHLDFYNFKFYTPNIPWKEMKDNRLQTELITESLAVDSIVQFVNARCHFEHANNVTNYLAILRLLKIISTKQAKHFYPILIMGAKPHKVGGKYVMKPIMDKKKLEGLIIEQLEFYSNQFRPTIGLIEFIKKELEILYSLFDTSISQLKKKKIGSKNLKLENTTELIGDEFIDDLDNFVETMIFGDDEIEEKAGIRFKATYELDKRWLQFVNNIFFSRHSAQLSRIIETLIDRSSKALLGKFQKKAAKKDVVLSIYRYLRAQ